MAARRISMLLAVVLGIALVLSPATSAHKLTFEGEIWCHDALGAVDAVVDQDDLQQVLDAWGECPDPGDCPADLNGNGRVGRLDLISALAHWGPCHCPGDLNRDGAWTIADRTLAESIKADNPPCQADIDENGSVDGLDYSLEVLSWTSEPDSDPRADFDGDGFLSVLDVELVYTVFGEGGCEADLDGNGTVEDEDLAAIQHLIDDHDISECPYSE